MSGVGGMMMTTGAKDRIDYIQCGVDAAPILLVSVTTKEREGKA